MARAKKNNVRRPQSKEAVSLAASLREAAEASGLSVYEIAKRSGVSQSTLNRFLNGTRENIQIDIADKLMRVLNLTVVSRS